jgi:hypothetical protein
MQKFTWNDVPFKYLFLEVRNNFFMHCSNGHSHKRENIFLEKLNKNDFQMFFIWSWEDGVLAPFSPKHPLFLFSAHQSHHLLPPISSPSLSHRRQASWPAFHNAAEAAWPSGPASASEIFRRPTKSRATPSGSLHAAAFLSRGRYWRHGKPPLTQQGGCTHSFAPGLTFPCGSSPGCHSLPSRL